MIDLPDFDAKEYIERACNFIKNIVEQSNSKGVVVGLSGGIDSTVVACLAVRALGANNVKGFILPSSTTSDQDLYDADVIKHELDIQVEYISITELHKNFLNIFDMDYLPDDNKLLASMNVKPRLRMTILYYYATIYNSLVIGTGNKTELNLGYFTKFGDGGVDLSPIGDLYKEDVRKVAYELDIPSYIIEKPPTAGLKNNQTDEEEIGMSYQILDRILCLYLDEKHEAQEISEIMEIPLNEVQRIINMVVNTKHKRLPAPILNKYP